MMKVAPAEPVRGGWLGWWLASASLEGAMETLLIILGVVLVAVIAGGGALLAPRARRSGKAAQTGPMHGQGGTATAARPSTRAPEAGAAPPGEVSAPPPVAEVPAAPTPTVEKPPPSAGRMVRLRSRLA